MAFTSVPVAGRVVYNNGTNVSSGTVTFTLPRAMTNGTTRSAPFTFSLTAEGYIPSGSTVFALREKGTATTPSMEDGYIVSVTVDGVERQIGRYYAKYSTKLLDLGGIVVPLAAGAVSWTAVTGKPVLTNIALTDAATVAIDATAGSRFKVTLGGNRTLGNPTGAYDGQIMTITVAQDGTGSRTVTLGNKYRLANGVTVTWSTVAGRKDKLAVQYDSTDDKFDIIAFQPGFGA